MAYTSLHLYRPTRPPLIEVREVIRFLKNLSELHPIRNAKIGTWAQVKFGNAIDLDPKPTHTIEPIHDYMGEVVEIDWDVDEFRLESFEQVMAVLSNSPGQIYRCSVGLGPLAKPIIDRFLRPEGDEPLHIDGLSFSCGPITSYDIRMQEEYVIGWIGLTFSGGGSLYPWKPRDLIERAEASPELREIRELCRQTWPIEKSLPDLRVRHLREQMGELWPYERTDEPMDWLWGVG